MNRYLFVVFLLFWQVSFGQHVFEFCYSAWCNPGGNSVTSNTKESAGISTNDRMIVLLDRKICMFDTASNRLKCKSLGRPELVFEKIVEMNPNRFLVTSIIDTINSKFLYLTVIDSAFEPLHSRIIQHDTNSYKLHWPTPFLSNNLGNQTKVQKVLLTPNKTILIGLHAIDANDRLGFFVLEFDSLLNNLGSKFIYGLDSETNLRDIVIGTDSNFYFLTRDTVIGKVIKLSPSLSYSNSVAFSRFYPYHFNMLGNEIFIAAQSDSGIIKLVMDDQLQAKSIYRLVCDTGNSAGRVVFLDDKLIIETQYGPVFSGLNGLEQRNYILTDTTDVILTKKISYFNSNVQLQHLEWREWGTYSRINNTFLNVNQLGWYPNGNEVIFTVSTLDLNTCNTYSHGTPNCFFVPEVLMSASTAVFIDSISMTAVPDTLQLSLDIYTFSDQTCNMVQSTMNFETDSRTNFYPNPSNGNVNYSITEVSELIIYSLDGKIVQRKYLPCGEGVVQTMDLTNGIYYFVLIGSKAISTSKIVLIE